MNADRSVTVDMRDTLSEQTRKRWALQDLATKHLNLAETARGNKVRVAFHRRLADRYDAEAAALTEKQ